IAHQQAAIAAALDAEMRRTGDLALDQIFGDRGEILVGTQALFLERSLVPAWAVLTATTDIGDHIDTALAEPATTDRCAVGGGQRNLETTVTVLQGRVAAVEFQILVRDHEIRH